MKHSPNPPVCSIEDFVLPTPNPAVSPTDRKADLDGAVQAIANGRRRRIDLGMIDGDYFANGASIGLSTMIGETVPHNLKRYAGRLGYLAWELKCAVRFKPFKLSITQGGRTETLWATEVRMLNGRHHGGVELSEEADVSSREILIQAVLGRSKLALAADWYAKFFKLRSKNACSRDFKGELFALSTVPPQRISIDG